MTKLKYSFKNDILFKMYFLRNQEQLKWLIALILRIPLGSITEFIIINTEMPPETIRSKYSHLDINMKVNGKVVNLEIQVGNEGDYVQRAAFLAAREYSMNVPSGKPYTAVPPVIVISIINFKLWKAKKVHTVYHIWEDDEHELMLKELEWHFFELPKLGKEINIDDELNLWLKLFDTNTEEDIKKLQELGVPFVQQVINSYRELTGDSEFLRLAWMREDAKRREAAALHHARETEREKWQVVVAEQAAALADKDAEIMRLLALLEEKR